MARTPGLLGIVAQDRSFLMTVERLDRRIDVENPGLGEQRLHAKGKMAAQPARAFRLVDRFEGAPDRIFADDPFHAEQLRQHRVAAQRRDMGVALVASQHRQHRRAQNVPLPGRVGALITERAVRHEGIKQPARLEKIYEERQLPKRRHRRSVVPLHSDRPIETVEFNPRPTVAPHNQRLFTRKVGPTFRRIARHAPENAPSTRLRKVSTAVSRMNDLVTVACPARDAK